MSIIRQNFHSDSESSINDHIYLELEASYTYLNLAYFFDRSDVALGGFQKCFLKFSDKKLEKAKALMEYQNKRGGRIVFQDLSKTDISGIKIGQDAMNYALKVEKSINQSLIKLHDVSSRVEDPHFSEFLEEEFMTDQVDLIETIGKNLTNIERAGPGIGEFMFDHELKE